MALMIHDTTGTQTDCEKPLSRKKLKQLMPQRSLALTARMLAEKTGRVIGRASISTVKEKQRARRDKRKLFEKRALPDGTTFQLMPNAADLVDIKPTLFERLGGLFGGFKKKFERMQAKGR
jgi:hypothetical protein